MNKKIVKQIRNEWRSNLLLFLELLLVSVIMWYVVDYLYVKCTIYTQPRGFNTEHCYKIDMAWVGKDSPEYDATDDESDDNVDELVERLRRRPELEAVSLSINSHPYNGSNRNVSARLDTMRSKGFVAFRCVTPDFLRVFRYEGTRGETPEQLAEMLTPHNFLASDNLFSHHGITLTSLVNRQFSLGGDTVNTYQLAAALKTVRYHDFANSSRTLVYNQTRFNYEAELCVRVKPNQDIDFINHLKADSDAQLRVGNLYISEVYSFKDIRRLFQQEHTSEFRNQVTGMTFLLLNIFLGLLGTFWFRTQQRRSEVALHIAFGASRKQVFIRLLSEGFVLLLFATVLAIAIDFNLTKAELNQFYNGSTFELGRFAITVCITFILIAFMILLGIWFPARKAMRIAPAEALHEE